MFRLTVIILALALSTDASAAITQAQCAQIRQAIKTYGMTVVLWGARVRGYTEAEVAYARRVCRI